MWLSAQYRAFFYLKVCQLSSGSAMAAVVPIVVVPAVLFAVRLVVVPAVTVAIGINNASRCRFYNHNTRWWWRMVIPITMPVAIIIARVVRTIGTG